MVAPSMKMRRTYTLACQHKRMTLRCVGALYQGGKGEDMGMFGMGLLSGLGQPTVEQIGQSAHGAAPAAKPTKP